MSRNSILVKRAKRSTSEIVWEFNTLDAKLGFVAGKGAMKF